MKLSKVSDTDHFFYLMVSLMLPAMSFGLTKVTGAYGMPDAPFSQWFVAAYMGWTMWWVFVFVGLLNVGQIKDAMLILMLPIAVIVVNSVLDNTHQLEVHAWLASIILTWGVSLVVCVVRWYRFWNSPFRLKQEKFI